MKQLIILIDLCCIIGCSNRNAIIIDDQSLRHYQVPCNTLTQLRGKVDLHVDLHTLRARHNF